MNQNIIPQNVETTAEQQTKKKSKAPIVILCTILIVISLLGALFFINTKDKNEKVQDDDNPKNEELEENIPTSEQIRKDFESGKLTTDEYVQQILYLEYEHELLNDKYQPNNKNVLIHVEDIINQYHDELSYETLSYYFSKVNLENVTFELDIENEPNSNISLSSLFVEDVYAKSETTTNLNKAILSSNGNFVVWYTTTGESAVDYNTAKKVADGLEKTVSIYKDKFGYDFYYKSNIFSKGSRYKNQLKILENSNIDTKYLETAMQVYLLKYDNEDSKGKYLGRTGILVKTFNSVRGGDNFGVVANPYIVLNVAAFNDYETLAQLYNHELFHHYQYEILCGTNECFVRNDSYIKEATANWASALSTNKTTNNGYLNEWAASYRALSNNLLSEKAIQKYGKETLGYALFVYLYNYSTFVENGTNKIIKSMYEEDSLTYLMNNASIMELTNVHQNIALKNITLDYDNKNLNADVTFNNKFPIQGGITHRNDNYKPEQTYRVDEMAPISSYYYEINMSSNYPHLLQIKQDSSQINDYLLVTLIAYNKGNYYIVDSSKNDGGKYTFNTNDYGKYEKIYIAVSNLHTNKTNHYTLTRKEIEKESYKYVSLIDCDAWNEDLEQTIQTYYYDKDGKIIERIQTNNWLTEDAAIDNYENTAPNYVNRKLEGKTSTFEYKDYLLYETVHSAINGHNSACGEDAKINFAPSIKLEGE